MNARYILRTLNWSLMMSALTFVPAASVYGSWLIGSIDYMICLPAHGGVLGAWFGPWPMPLDWERRWQEWQIFVSFGAIIGYFVGMLAYSGPVAFHVYTNT